jgi:hypothetical protein
MPIASVVQRLHDGRVEGIIYPGALLDRLHATSICKPDDDGALPYTIQSRCFVSSAPANHTARHS